jgi:hypothetical protein
MQLSQLTLEPHTRVILVEYEFILTLASLLFYSVSDIFDCCSVPGNMEDYVNSFDDF